MGVIYEGKVAGVSFEPARSNLRVGASLLKDKGIKLFLQNENDNPFDDKALAVYQDLGYPHGLRKIGYIPREKKRRILDVGVSNIEVKLLEYTHFKGKVVGMRVSVTSKVQKKEDSKEAFLRKIELGRRRIQI